MIAASCGVTPRRQDDVRGLQVAMDDPARVRGVERVGQLVAPLDRLFDRQRAVRQADVERAPLEQFHQQERAPLVIADVVERADVRMVQRRDDAGFAVEALERLGIVCQAGGQDLDRDVAIESSIPGAIDLAHPAGADRRGDFVRTKTGPTASGMPHYIGRMLTVMNELRLAVRRLRGDRWAAGGAILAAALGAGLNTAVFAVAYGVLLRPLPYADAGRLVVVDADARLPRIEDWRRALSVFGRAAAYRHEGFTVTIAGEPRLLPVALVDDHFFDTLGATPRAGRVWSMGESGVVVVSERLARQANTAPAALLGAQVTVGGATLTVAGVMPAAFAFPAQQVDVWMPAAAVPAIAFDRAADARHYRLIGRLKPGVTLSQASEDATRTRTEVATEPARPDRPPVRVTAVEESLVGAVRPVLLAFGAAAAIVLLIACANVATILIGRTVSRQRELAVRRALGASPSRLLLSVVAESLVVTGAGAGLGLLFALGSVRMVEKWAAGIVPRLGEIAIDWPVLFFATAAAALASMVAAIPAFRIVRAGAAQLRTSSATTPRPGDRRVRGALIVTQIALAVVLLAGGGLLTRTIAGLLRADLGVATHGAVVTQVLLTQETSFTAVERGPLLHELVRRVRALPGVTAAGSGSNLPPDNAGIEMRVTLAGDKTVHSLTFASATSGYLPALGARIVQGRDFSQADETGPTLVTIVSETAARALMEPGEVVGKQLPFSLPGLRGRGRPTVIGVVSDIKYAGLAAQAGPALYVLWKDLPAGHTYLAVRTAAAPLSLAPSIRAIVRELDPRMPLLPIRSLDEVVQRSVADRRLNALLGGSVALLAFAVAMVGLAGSLMRVVSERRKELAIRAALGATPAHAVRAIVGEGAILAGIGVTIGCAGALSVGRALRSLLHGVSPHDPATITAVCVFVTAASLLACYVPARRAARIDPLALLRE
jgi:putative ABC transport system permease protein